MKIIRDRLARAERHWTAMALIIAAVMLVPLVSIVGAFFAADQGAWRHLMSTLLPEYVWNSLALAALTSLLAGSLGVATAWLVAATEFPGRRLLGVLLVLPLAAPAYILAYFYADALDYSGPLQSWLRQASILGEGRGWGSIRNLPGAAVILALSLYPYVYLLARRAFERRAGDQFFAARSLGSSPWAAFWRIALPGARPAIAGGLALVMMETLADFGVAEHFAVPTFSTGIFRSWLLLGDQVAALRLSGVLLIFVFLLVGLEAWSRGERANNARLTPQPVRMQLTAARAALAIGVCALPVLIGFVIPGASFLAMAVQNGDAVLGRTFGEVVGNSLLVAAVVAAIALILAVVLAYTERLSRSFGVSFAVRLSTLGYALPGALLAVGLLAPLGRADQTLTGWLEQTLGWNGGLIFTGTIALLVYACTIRFLSVAFNAVQASLQQIPPRLEEAARSLGETPAGVMRRVHLPVLAPGFGAGAILVMIDVLRELPATLILRPFGFETLATRIHRLASDERLPEASLACLLLLGVGLMLVLVVSFADRSTPPRQGPRIES